MCLYIYIYICVCIHIQYYQYYYTLYMTNEDIKQCFAGMLVDGIQQKIPMFLKVSFIFGHHFMYPRFLLGRNETKHLWVASLTNRSHRGTRFAKWRKSWRSIWTQAER